MEEWRNIAGYDGLYQVSNWGRVKSLERITPQGHLLKEKIMKLSEDKDGYITVQLWKNGKGKTHKVHRLVATVFLGNPDNLPMVNHRDQNPSNNNVDNLEWCTHIYNCNYGTAIQRRVEKQNKTVYQYTIDGEFVTEYISTHDVQRQLGFNHGHICQCCNGRLKTAYGYIWRYA